jgi:predicted Zn-dependent peptidase
LHTLPNGLRIVIERMPDVRSAAAGFLVRTGARDETPELAGVSHFLEHMCFKGSPKRDWQRINIEFDEMGSNYNAFTSEERTFYYGWVRRADIERQIELLADMMRATLPPEEFSMEKNVILEEIAMANDRIEHAAFDFLRERIFEGHPLAWPVLGYEPTVRGLARDAMADYFAGRYTPENMVLIVAGNVEPPRVIDAAAEYCGAWQSGGSRPAVRTRPVLHHGTGVKTIDRFQQQIVALNYPAASTVDPLYETANAIASILGGDNSRFFWNIVQAGLSPRAGAYHLDYADCGLMILSGQCEPAGAEQLTEAMRREAARIRHEPVAEREVQRVKNKRRTALAVEAEAPYYRLVQIMDDVDSRGAPRTVEERLAAVDAVSVKSVAEYFERFPIDRDGYLISVGPRHWPQTN